MVWRGQKQRDQQNGNAMRELTEMREGLAQWTI
jgi:hypothetical protein